MPEVGTIVGDILKAPKFEKSSFEKKRVEIFFFL